ncbi:hypothetical protein NPX13_g11054 [Xylaria arbuscula]|uniref:Amidase domain-containing protein n=1 Tax=Xylaria arbuscula TaxID=114810 RepID=A0A9W8N3I0_9PEZI|nr:hypothetical protein NPX13_g11054 [Xylaria arbuscula]
MRKTRHYLRDSHRKKKRHSLVSESNDKKSEANALFSSAKYENAINKYEDATAICPHYLDYELAVLKSNIAACHLKLEQYKEAVQSATDALESLSRSEKAALESTKQLREEEPKKHDNDDDDEPEEEIVSAGAQKSAPAIGKETDAQQAARKRQEDILRIKAKALMRRARARSELGGWSNLSGAEEDYKTLSAMSNLTSTDEKIVRSQLRTLPARVKVAQEKEMGEMWRKLKDLGNGILKPFGLSTDNFQMVKDEKTGGYTVTTLAKRLCYVKGTARRHEILKPYQRITMNIYGHTEIGNINVINVDACFSRGESHIFEPNETPYYNITSVPIASNMAASITTAAGASWEEVAADRQRHRDDSLSSYKPSSLLDLPATDKIPLNTTSIPQSVLSPEDLEITEKNVEDLIPQLASGQWSAKTVVQAFMRRAALAQHLTNCVTEILSERALKRAAELDDHLAATGKPVGPLHGLPISVKEHIGMKGLDLNAGFVSWVGRVAEEDALILQILWNAGAVFYVRTTQPQTLMHLETSSNLYG